MNLKLAKLGSDLHKSICECYIYIFFQYSSFVLVLLLESGNSHCLPWEVLRSKE